MVRALIIACGLIAMAGPSASWAQTSASAVALDSRFLTQKRELAGVLGEVHFIRTLCNGQGDQFWRNQMRDFLDIEAATRERRRMLVDAFNQGYARVDKRLDACTDEAVGMERRLSERGRALADSIAAGYLR